MERVIMTPKAASVLVLATVVLALAGCAGQKAAPASTSSAEAPRIAEPKPPAPRKPADTPPAVTGTGSVGAPAGTAAAPPAAPPTRAATGKAPAGDVPPATASAYVFSPQQTVSASPASAPSPAPQAPTAPAANPPATDAAKPDASDAPQAEPPGILQLVVAASAGEVGVGEVVTVDVLASSETAVLDAPLHLAYDPQVLEFVDGVPGDFLTQGGSSIVFLADGVNRPGDVAVAAGRVAREQGASGSGLLCRVRLRGAVPGTTPVSVAQAKAWGTGGEELVVRSTGTRVVVR
jgi:hypothetical protein